MTFFNFNVTFFPLFTLETLLVKTLDVSNLLSHLCFPLSTNQIHISRLNVRNHLTVAVTLVYNIYLSHCYAVSK